MSLQMQGSSNAPEPRNWRLAIKRGFFCSCPRCGKGKLFRAFLKPVDACESCGADLHHQRADDLPPYITISIVGHIVVGCIVLAEKYGDWPTWAHMALWPALTVILSLLIMQPVKGAVIGLQWGQHMHGFGDSPDQPTQELKPGLSHGMSR